MKLKAEERPAAKPAPKAPPAPRHDADLSDEELWQAATDGSAPLADRSGRIRPEPRPIAHDPGRLDPELAAYDELRALVDGALPFDLSGTAEYLEGAARGLDPRFLKKLKRGEYAVEDHLDLHGHVQKEAKAALDQFIAAARHEGKRCVLVVHGRGLHSEDQVPVLKEAVRRWLSTEKFARQVLAFCSARQADGGGGALYLLLRR